MYHICLLSKCYPNPISFHFWNLWCIFKIHFRFVFVLNWVLYWDWGGGRESTNKKEICTLWFLYHSCHFLYITKINCIISMAYNIGHMWNHQELSYLWIWIWSTTDYGMNLENHYSQVPVLSFVEHTGVVPFNNEMTRAITGKLFQPKSFSSSLCGKM